MALTNLCLSDFATISDYVHSAGAGTEERVAAVKTTYEHGDIAEVAGLCREACMQIVFERVVEPASRQTSCWRRERTEPHRKEPAARRTAVGAVHPQIDVVLTVIRDAGANNIDRDAAVIPDAGLP